MVSGYAEMAHHRMSSNSYIFENPKLTILTDKEFPICKHGKIVLAIHRKALFWILRAIFFAHLSENKVTVFGWLSTGLI